MLNGLRVLELATGVAGPYCGKLLAQQGAVVMRIEPDAGDVTMRIPVDGEHDDRPGLLYEYLNGDKDPIKTSVFELEGGIEWADVIIDDGVDGDLTGTPLHPSTLRATSRGPMVIATITAWGFDAMAAGRPVDELAVREQIGADNLRSLALSLADRGAKPPGYRDLRTQYLAGEYAAAAIAAAVAAGEFTHLDIAWVEAAAADRADLSS